MNLLSLDDDVLFIICSLLIRQDACSFSLVSQRARQVAFRRTLSSAQSYGFDQLPRLTRYMLSSERGTDLQLARYLEELTIENSTFQVREDTKEILDDRLFWLYRRRNDFSQANLLRDLLASAPNLRTLSFKRFQPCLEQCPSLGAAIISLRKLASLSLYTIDDNTLVFLKAMSTRVQIGTLTLAYGHPGSNYTIAEQSITLDPLLDALRLFSHLNTLSLSHFTPSHGIESLARFIPSSFPSIRHLRLSEASPAALDLVERCPNLTTLDFSLPRDNDDWTPRFGSQWPSLRQVTVRYPPDLNYFVNRLSTVDILQVSDHEALRGPPYPNAIFHDDSIMELLPHLFAINPISLYFSLEYSPRGDAATVIVNTPLWEQIAHSSPRLRSFELQLRWDTKAKVSDVNWEWLFVRPFRLDFLTPSHPSHDAYFL